MRWAWGAVPTVAHTALTPRSHGLRRRGAPRRRCLTACLRGCSSSTARPCCRPPTSPQATECEWAVLRRLDARLGRVERGARPGRRAADRAARLGDAHEERQLEAYRQQFGAAVVEIERPRRPARPGRARRRAAADARGARRRRGRRLPGDALRRRVPRVRRLPRADRRRLGRLRHEARAPREGDRADAARRLRRAAAPRSASRSATGCTCCSATAPPPRTASRTCSRCSRSGWDASGRWSTRGSPRPARSPGARRASPHADGARSAPRRSRRRATCCSSAG